MHLPQRDALPGTARERGRGRVGLPGGFDCGAVAAC